MRITPDSAADDRFHQLGRRSAPRAGLHVDSCRIVQLDDRLVPWTSLAGGARVDRCVYTSSAQSLVPFHDWTAVVTRCGRICYRRRKVNLSQVFAGQKVGVKQTADFQSERPVVPLLGS
jgi:hypothetical protein